MPPDECGPGVDPCGLPCTASAPVSASYQAFQKDRITMKLCNAHAAVRAGLPTLGLEGAQVA